MLLSSCYGLKKHNGSMCDTGVEDLLYGLISELRKERVLDAHRSPTQPEWTQLSVSSVPGHDIIPELWTTREEKLSETTTGEEGNPGYFQLTSANSHHHLQNSTQQSPSQPGVTTPALLLLRLSSHGPR
ncbi:hypothetical protein lerEdw1_018953 [Lerista edwardsae]|nr:hypothetical protein lerEdw1_018953 [Lerista edwardsae]